jgi:hypothetical protein
MVRHATSRVHSQMKEATGMRKGTAAAISAGALVAGLILGTVGLASAATTSSQAPASPGARLGLVMRQAGGTLADAVAKLTGKTPDQVRTDRQAGKSFADIAKASGVSQDKVLSAALDTRKAALDSAVKSGRITQAQADTALANMKTRLTSRVTSTAPGCNGTGAGAGAGGRGMGGGRGAGCGGACVAAGQ